MLIFWTRCGCEWYKYRYRRSSTFVQYELSPLIRLSYAEFGLSYTLTNQHFELSHSGTVKFSLRLILFLLSARKADPNAAQTNTWVCSRWLAEIAGSNPAGGMDSCLLWVLCDCQVEVSATGWSLVQRILSSVVCLRRRLLEATSLATRQQVQSPASERAGSLLAMPITRRNEKAGQSASSALVHNLTSQRWSEEF
jgi:hypothetical protein